MASGPEATIRSDKPNSELYGPISKLKVGNAHCARMIEEPDKILLLRDTAIKFTHIEQILDIHLRPDIFGKFAI